MSSCRFWNIVLFLLWIFMLGLFIGVWTHA